MITTTRQKSVFTRALCTAVAALALAAPMSAGAAERVYQLRSIEDPTVDSAAARAWCTANAPFAFNVVLAARLWVHRTRTVDGLVTNESAMAVGTAYACAQLTDFGFPSGLAQNFHLKLDVPSGTYVAGGQCTLLSNNVPTGGIVLAGCHLKVLDKPAGVIGGIATSSSVFNPFRVPGFNTGSYWTLHLYTDEVTAEDLIDHSNHDHDLQLIQDTRSEAEISAAAVTAG